MNRHRAIVVAAIGTTQTIAWASSYYMPAILGAPIAAALHLSTSVFFGMFSAALLLSAAVGPSVGRLIDRHGGRLVLAASNLVIAAGLVILAAAHGIAGLAIAWIVLGLGIGMGLYDPAFAALTWLYGREARGAITGITLIAGFASTIGWPASALFLHELGWRAACLFWAGLNLLVAAPVNWLTIPRHGMPAPPPRVASELPATAAPPGAMPILAFFFAATWFVQGAMAAHLPALLQRAGASATAAIAAASLVGPAQVGARLVEFGLLRSFHPISSARIASVLHPIGAVFLVLFGAPGIVAFALLHGAGNGMITIAKGTLPLAFFGPQGYGLRSGLLSAPARVLQSAAPFLFGLLLDRFGINAVWWSAGLCVAAFGSLLALRRRRAPAALPRGPIDETAPFRIASGAMSDLPKPDGIPDNWIEQPSEKRGGKVYINPDNPNDRVRIMPGDLHSPHPTQQRPYAIDQNGGYRDLNGDLILGPNPSRKPEAHIPLDVFRFRR